MTLLTLKLTQPTTTTRLRSYQCQMAILDTSRRNSVSPLMSYLPVLAEVPQQSRQLITSSAMMPGPMRWLVTFSNFLR